MSIMLSTYIDKGHIHNHIIFNNVNIVTGKFYQSNKKSYHKIRYQSDKLCKENNLSVIDEQKVLRKNTRQAESLDMKMSRQRKGLLGKAGFNLTLTA